MIDRFIYVRVYFHSVTIGKAIETLRAKLGLSQRDFAAHVATTLTTVSRWENGRTEPYEQSLLRLARLAESASLKSLANLFEAKRRAAIRARASVSAGAGCYVPVDHLKYISAVADRAAKELQTRIREEKHLSAYGKATLREACRLLELARAYNEIYIGEGVSSSRIEENTELIRLHGPMPELHGLQPQILYTVNINEEEADEDKTK